MHNNTEGKLPFFTTMSIVAIAVGGISWTHGNLLGQAIFIFGTLTFVISISLWLKQSLSLFRKLPKLGYSALVLGLVAVFMFVFSGVLERGYDIATKSFGVNGKIDQNFGVSNSKEQVEQTVNVDMLVHISKMPIKIIDQSESVAIRYGSDFDVFFKVKNLQDKPIKFRALLSVIPSTSASLVKARKTRYPVINLPARSVKTVVLPLHMSKNIPQHNHDLILGVGLFNIANNLRK